MISLMTENPSRGVKQLRQPAKRTGITGRVLHGVGAGAVAYGLGVASNLLLLPLYLRVWSVAVYGEWMAVYALVNYLGNLDFGVTAAAVNAATMAWARGDWSAFRRIQGTAWAAALAIAGVGLALFVIPATLVFQTRWLNLTALSPGEARRVIFWLAVALLASIPGRQLMSIHVAVGRFPVYQWLYNAITFATCAATALALIAGARPTQVAVLTAAMSVLSIIVCGATLRARDARLVPSLGLADWGTARELAAPTGQFGLSLLANIVTLQAPVILLSRVLGGPAVALFTTTRTVVNVMRATTTLLRAPLRPEFAAVSATRTKAQLGRLLRIAVSTDTIVALTLFSALWSAGDWLIRFWSHGRIATSPGFMHWMLVSTALEGFLLALGSTGWATNRLQALSLGQFATAMAALMIATAIVGELGVTAVPIAAIAPLLLIMGPVIVRHVCRETEMTVPFVLGRLMLPFAAVGLFVAVVSHRLETWNLQLDWLAASVAAPVSFFVAALIGAFVFLTRADRESLLRRFPPQWTRPIPNPTIRGPYA